MSKLGRQEGARMSEKVAEGKNPTRTKRCFHEDRLLHGGFHMIVCGKKGIAKFEGEWYCALHLLSRKGERITALKSELADVRAENGGLRNAIRMCWSRDLVFAGYRKDLPDGPYLRSVIDRNPNGGKAITLSSGHEHPADALLAAYKKAHPLPTPVEPDGGNDDE